ncbi:MAG: DUF2490 domain-containing protein [Bacteroidales bacterium]|nr:DUF2490 domain-containing protein [Bacteroidales bacterium]
MRIKKKILLSVFALIMSLSLSAQDDWGIWQYISLNKTFSPKVGALLRLEHRSKGNAQDLDCGLVMPGVWYKPVSWLTLGFIYDFAMAQTANRHVLLPYIQVSQKWGQWSFSGREMGQYVIKPEAFLLRSKVQLSCRIPNSIVSPILFIEPYTSGKYIKHNEDGNVFIKAADAIGVAKSSNVLGVALSLGSKSTLELGYNYYYLGSASPARHIVYLGFAYRL